MERSQYKFLEEQEQTHWWFVARRKILKSFMENIFKTNKSNKILEVGCGTGGNLKMLSNFGEVYAVEMDDKARKTAHKKNIALEVIEGFLPDNLNIKDKNFDLIVILDVLEHIEDDKKSLEILRDRLSENGTLLITVPAYQWLYSKHDVLHHHKRRYSKQDLISKISEAGFNVKYCSYFNFWLFPIAALSRLVEKMFNKETTVDSNSEVESQPIGLINWAFTKIFASESALIGKISFPFGLSLIASARKLPAY